MSLKTYEEKMKEYLDRLLPTIYEVIDENDELIYDSDESFISCDSLYD